MPDPPAGTRRYLPHAHALQIGSAGQLLPIRTPRHSEKDSIRMLGVLVPLYTGTRRGVPHPDSIIPSTTSQQTPIGAPSHSRDDPAMSTQHLGSCHIGYIPDGDQRIRASAGELGAIWTPVDVKEGDRKSTRLNSSHGYISYAVFCLKKKKRE